MLTTQLRDKTHRPLTADEEAAITKLESSSSACTTCPAAHNASGADVSCGIEGIRIVGRQNPGTVTKLCFSDYTNCPSWRRAWDERKTQEENAKGLLREKAKNDEIDAARAAGEPID